MWFLRFQAARSPINCASPGCLNHSYDKDSKQSPLLKSAPPETALGSFRIFENAEPRATIDTSQTARRWKTKHRDHDRCARAASVRWLQLPPVVDISSKLWCDFNTLPVAS